MVGAIVPSNALTDRFSALESLGVTISGSFRITDLGTVANLFRDDFNHSLRTGSV
jgi:hypothetical protein